MVDLNGKLVAGPLLRGSRYCSFHAKPFVYTPAVTSKPLVLILIDCETTGTDISQCRIVELAATQAFDHTGLPGASFAQVVRVDDEILRTPSALAASAVHGISDDEILASPPFVTVWERFLEFVDSLLNNCVRDNDDSDNEPGLPQIPDEPPTLLAAAHNGYVDMEMCAFRCFCLFTSLFGSVLSYRYKFDFPLLLAECVRHELSLSPLRRWLFADTLAILEATKQAVGEVGPCLKLQCLVCNYATPEDLRAHRAKRYNKI